MATEPPESPLMTTVKIDEAPFYIAMSERDKLAACSSVSLEDMAGRCWVLFERRLHPPLYDTIMHGAEARGILPTRVKHVIAPEEAFPSVADGSSLAFCEGGRVAVGQKWCDRSPARRRYLTPENLYGISCRQQLEGG